MLSKFPSLILLTLIILKQFRSNLIKPYIFSLRFNSHAVLDDFFHELKHAESFIIVICNEVNRVPAEMINRIMKSLITSTFISNSKE